MAQFASLKGKKKRKKSQRNIEYTAVRPLRGLLLDLEHTGNCKAAHAYQNLLAVYRVEKSMLSLSRENSGKRYIPRTCVRHRKY